MVVRALLFVNPGVRSDTASSPERKLILTKPGAFANDARPLAAAQR